MVVRINATFAVNTPLFGGGAMPDASAELRPPSIKGVLRFWWRALAWSRCGGDLDRIRAEEAKIFGAAGDDADKSRGQASFLLRITDVKLPAPLMPPHVLKGSDGVVGVGARYFGYGLMEAFDRFDKKEQKQKKAGELTRPCLPAPFEFTVELVSRSGIDATLVDALKLMGLLGGLGSRTRRGWGSLSLLSLTNDGKEIWEAPRDTAAYKTALLKVLDEVAKFERKPSYSAFYEATRIDIVNPKQIDGDPLHLLNFAGEQMLRYRSWGRPDKDGVNSVGKVQVERNFRDDHDWFKARERASTLAIGRPRRIIFGLPHNYSQNFLITTEIFERRASPLLVHVHQLANPEPGYVAVLTVLASDFLPQGERLRVTNGRAESSPNASPDWAVLDEFIGGTSKTTGEPYFPNRTPVLP